MLTGRISVIGLGDMGSALARALLKGGGDVRVWNRSPEKAEPLRREGAIVAASVPEAIGGCDTAVVCLSNYAAWKQITDDEKVRENLDGITIVQLTGGTLPAVREHAEFMTVNGAQLIEGAILCLPGQIGTDTASIVIAGPQETVVRNDKILRCLAPNLSYLGDNLVAPVVLSRAAVSGMLGFMVGTINGAAMCKAGGVPLSAYHDQVKATAAMMQSEPLRLIDAIAAEETRDTQASLAVWAEGHEALLDVSRHLGIETLFHDGLWSMFEKSLAQGLGDFDLSAMDQVFRTDRTDQP